MNRDLRNVPEINNNEETLLFLGWRDMGKRQCYQCPVLGPPNRNGTHSQTCPTGPETLRKGSSAGS